MADPHNDVPPGIKPQMTTFNKGIFLVLAFVVVFLLGSMAYLAAKKPAPGAPANVQKDSKAPHAAAP